MCKTIKKKIPRDHADPQDRYRVTNSGRWKDLRMLFNSDTEDERHIEDIKEDEAKNKIMLRNSET